MNYLKSTPHYWHPHHTKHTKDYEYEVPTTHAKHVNTNTRNLLSISRANMSNLDPIDWYCSLFSLCTLILLSYMLTTDCNGVSQEVIDCTWCCRLVSGASKFEWSGMHLDHPSFRSSTMHFSDGGLDRQLSFCIMLYSDQSSWSVLLMRCPEHYWKYYQYRYEYYSVYSCHVWGGWQFYHQVLRWVRLNEIHWLPVKTLT